MKNSYSYVISGVLLVAVIVLYILHFASNSGAGSVSKNGLAFANDSTVILPIAYIDVDSLLHNYNYAKDIQESLLRKEESARAALNQKERHFNSEAEKFQRNMQNNAFLSDERARQEQQRIMKLQQDYEVTAQRLSQEFSLEQQKLNFQLNDTIKMQLKEFNASKGYQLIFSNTLLYADDKYNITGEVIEFLNKRYGPTTAVPASTPDAAATTSKK